MTIGRRDSRGRTLLKRWVFMGNISNCRWEVTSGVTVAGSLGPEEDYCRARAQPVVRG